MSVTLEEIKAEHAKVAAMIVQFEAQTQPVLKTFPAAQIWLEKGEEYAGIVLGKDGAPSHHLILLAGDTEDVTWAEAKDWAKKAGGELPTRREQSLLFANLKEHFEGAYYWSGEQHASYSYYAWSQDFTSGDQGYHGKISKLRARAVRRLEIQ